MFLPNQRRNDIKHMAILISKQYSIVFNFSLFDYCCLLIIPILTLCQLHHALESWRKLGMRLNVGVLSQYLSMYVHTQE